MVSETAIKKSVEAKRATCSICGKLNLLAVAEPKVRTPRPARRVMTRAAIAFDLPTLGRRARLSGQDLVKEKEKEEKKEKRKGEEEKN